jgi:serine/threonine-protein kinase
MLPDRVSSLPGLPEEVSAVAVGKQLERVLTSAVFRRADRLRRFLRYAAEQAANGCTDRLKEYSLGVSVFDKKHSFDPRFDPIVRVEAGRLRARLKQYYETEGREDPLIISLPKGCYVPRFVRQYPKVTLAPEQAAEAPEPQLRGRDSIAVLPFLDHSPHRDQEYFCDGLAEELINALTKLRGLRVAAWTPALRLQRNPGEIVEIARELKVRNVVTGSVRKGGDRLRVTVQLIDATDESYIWSEVYDRELRDVFAIQDEISRTIADKFKIRFVGGHGEHPNRHYTNNLDAYNFYLLGRYYWNRRSEATLRRGIEYFEQAIALDPQYAAAFSGMADSYSLLGNYGVLPARSVKAKAMSAAVRAVEIDPTLAEAHTALGHVKATYCWDWSGAKADYERAMSLNPSYATVYHWYAMTYLMPLGQLDAAIAAIQKAEELDTVSVSIKRDAAMILYNARRFDAAFERCNRMIDLDPNFYGAYWALGLTLEAVGNYGDSIDAIQVALVLSPDSPRLLSALGHVYGVWNKRSRAEDILARLTELSAVRHVSPFDFALVQLALGHEEEFFERLQQAFDAQSYELVTMLVDPRLESVRSDPRFFTILRSIGLSPAEPALALR